MAEDDMPKGATHKTSELDLLLDLDEPEQFVWAAVQGTANRPRWATVHEALLEIEKKLAEANEPSQKDAKEDSSPD